MNEFSPSITYRVREICELNEGRKAKRPSDLIVQRKAPFTYIRAPYVDMTAVVLETEIWQVPYSEFYRYRNPLLVVARVAGPVKFAVCKKTGTVMSRVQLTSVGWKVCNMSLNSVHYISVERRRRRIQ